MAKQAGIVPTLTEPAADLAAEMFTPTKTTRIVPLGMGLTKQPLEDGTFITTVNFIVSPFEALAIVLTDEVKTQLVRSLTGGIVLPG